MRSGIARAAALIAFVLVFYAFFPLPHVIGPRAASDRRLQSYEPAPQSDRVVGEDVGQQLLLRLVFFSLLCLCQFAAYKRSRFEAHTLEEVLPYVSTDVQVDPYQQRLELQQQFEPIELCGIEAKNRYRSEPDSRLYIHENSDCCQRFCASVNREATFWAHAGPTKESPVVLRMYKPYHLQGCCCPENCRPSMEVDLPDGTNVGRIFDPFKCCIMDQQIFDSDGKQKFGVAGTICQCGMCCACCADVHFDITDSMGGQVGQIVKPALTCAECCKRTNRFEIEFPAQCTLDDKRLLLGATMLLELQYFEVNKKK